MFKIIFGLIVSFCLFSLVASAAPGTAELREDNLWARQLQQRLARAIKKSSLRKSELGIMVSTRGSGERTLVYELNNDRSYIPASLTKVITAAASLNRLGPDHKFKTQLLGTGAVRGNVLGGDLILKGLGDPGFISESMWILVNHFVRTGIKVIEGDLIVDDSYFDSHRFDKGREDVRIDRAYDAPVGAMSFNWNSVNFYVRPGGKKGDLAQVFADPQNDYVKVVNKAVTINGRSNKIRIRRGQFKNNQDTFVIEGQIGKGRKEVVIYKSITHPAIWSGKQLRSFLQQRGIVVKGKVYRFNQALKGQKPLQGKLFAEAESKPLSLSVADMMKFSNNYVAEMLTKHIGVSYSGQPGSMQAGVDGLVKYMASVGVSKGSYSLLSPSGLSRDNKFRPKDLHQILASVADSFNIFPEFLTSLPIAGRDGTLKKRMNGSSAEEWLRAKTGRLSGALGLAGYAGRKNGHTLTFVFMFNGRPKKMAQANKLFDQMGALLVR